MAKENWVIGGLCVKNHQVGWLGAYIAGIATLSFALSMLIPYKAVSGPLSYGTSLFIAIGYLLMTCGLAAVSGQNLKGCTYASIAFAAVYATLISLVYYTQLTTVAQKAVPVELMDALTYRPGTWIFNLDMLGYAMLSFSTVFAGFSILVKTKGDKWLRGLLLIHGVFAVACLLFPMLGIFTRETGAASGDLFGVIALEFWCVYFLPVTVLFARYMKQHGLGINKKTEMDV
jgi:hypothetical protein